MLCVSVRARVRKESLVPHLPKMTLNNPREWMYLSLECHCRPCTDYKGSEDQTAFV